MTYEDDAALNLYEWVEWLEMQDQLDVPAGPRDKNKIVVILADELHIVEAKLWALLTSAGADSNLAG